MNQCKIVEDLLPLYAEELISEESGNFIREHASACPRCAQLLERASLPQPEAVEDPKVLKKAIRRNSLKMMVRGTAAFLLILGLAAGLAFGIAWFIQWKNGSYPVEQVFVSPDGRNSITVVDWDSSGYFMEGQGSLVWHSSWMAEAGDGEHSLGGFSGNEGMNCYPWENMEGEWAPDGYTFFATVDLVDGGKGMFIHTGDGTKENPIRWEGALTEHGIIDTLTELCRANPEFPTGWETIDFTFYAWGEDSETVTLVYETDNGLRGFVDYHFPTETIVAID